MAAPASVDEFLDLVKKSGVADEKRLDAYLHKVRAGLPPEPAKVAGQLVHDGLLTNFQAENILAGKWRRFSIGKYKVLERLGAGGFAQVYLCEHKLMRRRVAVKVLPAAKAKDSSALERFMREARAVAALDHPNIVHAYDIDQDEDLHFLVMEYVDGANLQEIVKKSGPLDVSRACHYMRQAALALQHAHEHGLIHRDIKPGNILVDRAGGVKVLDMGLARFFNENDEEDQLTKKHDDGTLGTADYLSPEQAMDSHDVDIRTDIYSLGVTFYFLLTGRAPFEGLQVAQKLLAQQMKQPRPISDYRKDAPTELLAIINTMMAKNKEQRYPTPGEVADALAAFTQDEIAPPSEAELPSLSPAAKGSDTSDTGTSARSDTPSIPGRAGSASGSVKKPASGSGPRTPTPVKPAAATAPTEAEAPPWETDTAKLVAPSGTTPRSSKSKKKLKSSKSSRTLLVGLLIAFLVVGFLGVGAVGTFLWWKFGREPAPIAKTGPPKAVVSRDPARKSAFRTIQQAINNAKQGSIIELMDDTYDENVHVEATPGRSTESTLQAAAGKTILWRSGTDKPGQPILKLNKAPDFKLKGQGITLDGTIDKKRKVDDLVMITLASPGLVIEDLEFVRFARSAIFVMNAAGTSEQPIKLLRLTTHTEKSEKPRGAVYFDANPQVIPNVNDHIEIRDCDFHGLDPAKAIQFEDKSVFGDKVTWPGR